MKTSLMTVSVLIVAVVAGLAGLGRASPGPQGQVAQGTPQAPLSPAAAVFELKYRGLSVPDDPLSYRSYSGWGGFDDKHDPFVQAVQSQVRDCTVVYNGSLPRAKWAVVELKDRDPIAFYFDADGDGKLAAREKFPLTPPARPGFGYAYAFITSDFLMRTEDQREIPFRLLLVGYSSGAGQVSYMWSPCCVLEGQATLAGEPTRLVLYTDGFSGSFTKFGSCSLALLPAGQELNGPVSRNTLSSLIQHKGVFYRVQLSGTHGKDNVVRVAFAKDTTPTGQVTVALKGKETGKVRLSNVMITSTTDPSIYLSIAEALGTLPAGQYRLSSGTIGYGAQSEGDWQVTFNEGPGFAMEAARTGRIELGAPSLSVRAIKEADRYSSGAKEQSTFTRGTPIFFTPQIKGAAGEAYVHFSQKQRGSSRMTDVQSHLTIVGPDGKQVTSADMEYG